MKLEEEYLSQLAKDIATGKVFCSYFIPEEQQQGILGVVFMPLFLGALKEYTEEEIKNIGFIYEYYEKSMSRSINGYPIFYSCGFVNKEDAAKIFERVKKITEVLDNI